jgi:hypothetical protein
VTECTTSRWAKQSDVRQHLLHDNMNTQCGRTLLCCCCVQVMDPVKASYGVDNALYAVGQLAQTTMRRCGRSACTGRVEHLKTCTGRVQQLNRTCTGRVELNRTCTGSRAAHARAGASWQQYLCQVYKCGYHMGRPQFVFPVAVVTTVSVLRICIAAARSCAGLLTQRLHLP